jgi:hypothetical protein
VSLPDLTRDPQIDAILPFSPAGRLDVLLGGLINCRRIVDPGRACTDGQRYTAALGTLPDGGFDAWPVRRVIDLTPDDAGWCCSPKRSSRPAS